LRRYFISFHSLVSVVSNSLLMKGYESKIIEEF